MPSHLRGSGVLTFLIAAALALPVAPAAAAGEPTNTGLPEISGVPVIGTVLTATSGSWTGSPTAYFYQWRRCAPSGGTCVDISGATSSSYTSTQADSLHTLRVRVSAVNASGETDADSDPTTVVFGQQAYAKASTAGGGDMFGYTIAVSGDTMVVGAPFEDSSATGINGNQADDSLSQSGAAYVFVRSGNGSWIQQAYLKSSNTDAGDRFGTSVAISGDTVVVGAPFEDASALGGESNNSTADSGAAYVFVRSGTGWSQQAYLKADNADADDQFGSSVAIDGEYVVVGAPQEDSDATGINGDGQDNSFSDSGAAYIFLRSAGSWTQQAYVKASNTGAFDLFGFSVAISEEIAIVGTYAEDSNATGINGDGSNNLKADAGAVYVFERNGATWSHAAYLKASNTDVGDHFGFSVAISGDYLLIGAPTEDSNATGVDGNQADNSLNLAGAAYLFRNLNGVWSQSAYIKASDPGAGDLFGFTVGISGLTFAIGAVNEASNATGINGSASSNSANEAGAAYLFTLRGGFTQVGYYKASNTEAGDQFGHSLGFTGETLVVGALNEDSSATGIDGNQADNNALASGAAYTFVVTGGIAYNAVNPEIVGVPVPGSTLAADPGEWYFTPTSFTYQWKRCPNNPYVCTNITGATGSTYVVTNNDVGSFLAFTILAFNPFGYSGAFASPTLRAGQFQRVGSDYTYIKASNTEEFDYFGTAVAIDGDTMVVGAPFEDSSATTVNGDQASNTAEDSGAVYVYVRTAGVWTQQAYLKANTSTAYASFGQSVAIDGDTIVVGAPDDGGSGAIYVFTRNAGVWTQAATLQASNAAAGDSFGYAVSISADTIVVGAPSEDSNATGINGNESDNSKTDSGAAYVFARIAGVWTQQAYLKASNTDTADTFGITVDIDADLIVIGAPRESSSSQTVNGNEADNSAGASGAAYLFSRTSGVWGQIAYLKAPDATAYDYFGTAVAVSGTTVVVGAPYEDFTQDDSGAVYEFSLASGVWDFKNFIKAPNIQTNDLFGTSLALDGDFLVVGNAGDDSAAVGVAGNMHDNTAPESGAAHVFVRLSQPSNTPDHLWDHLAYLKASNNDAGDVFGYAVAVSGDQVVVSARGEASNATGIDGDVNDNSAANSGAAYVRSLTGVAPRMVTAPTITGTASVGQTLTASTGTWAFAPTSYTYQWQLCDSDGSNCADITGATSNTYTTVQSDAGSRVLVMVSAINQTGTTVGSSLITPVITSAPVNTAPPAISGTTLVGQTLTADNGTWSYSPTSYTYQWQRCDSAGANCANISGATSNTRVLSPQDTGRKLTVVVTATNATGSTPATSNPSGLIASNVTPPPPSSPPVNLTVPVLSGSATVGSVLSATAGTWANSPTLYAYQWQRCDAAGQNCTNISGATNSTYSLLAADLGSRIRVTVVATNADGSGSSQSGISTVISAATTTPEIVAPANLAAPQINGEVRVGGVLTSTTGAWSNSPTAYTYLWLRCAGSTCTPVEGATQSTLTLVQADAGLRFQVRVTATNVGGSGAVTSEQTASVASKPINTARPMMKGKAKLGLRLTATTGTWQFGPTALTYQWWRCSQSGKCVKIAKATGKKVLVTKAMVGSRILVKVRASNTIGASISPSTKSRVVSR